MSRASYMASRQMTGQDFPFYAILIAAADLAVLNGDLLTANVIRHRWSHEFEKRGYDEMVAGKILEMFPEADVEALLLVAMRQADTNNTAIFKQCWPDLWSELYRRYHSPGGVLPEDTEEVSQR